MLNALRVVIDPDLRRDIVSLGFIKDLSLTEEWTRYAFPFAEMRQLSGWGAPHPPRIDEKKIYGVQWQVNQPGATFDISIDDVAFICK